LQLEKVIIDITTVCHILFNFISKIKSFTR